jgi:DNA-binding NtrC family response regulator
MPLEMQVKLLRVLQEQEFERVGGVNSIRVDVRIVTATNKNLEEEVKAGRFREDLFYRLNVVPIHLPPLRERRDDIDALVRYFVQQFNTKLRKGISRIEPVCLEALKSHTWPGNIRQLENVLERMVLMSDDDVLSVHDLPEDIAAATGAIAHAAEAGGEGASSFKDIVRKQTQAVERELIEKALDETGGNITRTAEKLGLSRKGLQLKIKELGLKR